MTKAELSVRISELGSKHTWLESLIECCLEDWDAIQSAEQELLDVEEEFHHLVWLRDVGYDLGGCIPTRN